jgi:hypothetical protein
VERQVEWPLPFRDQLAYELDWRKETVSTRVNDGYENMEQVERAMDNLRTPIRTYDFR